MASQSYTPVPGATVHQLLIKPIFDALEPREKLYAHHMAQAAWQASRIVMRQISSESIDIFDFIMDLYHACDGKWNALVAKCGVTTPEIECFLEYAAMFLCNLGNYYGEGDRKFVPDLTADALRKLASVSSKTTEDLNKIIGPLLSVPPYGLGYPSDQSASAYYPGTETITQAEIAMVSEIMAINAVGPENTRLQRVIVDGASKYEILQASVETDKAPRLLTDAISLVRGDHSKELEQVIISLEEASKHVANDKQSLFLKHYIDTFRTGSLEAFHESQKAWVLDRSATIEHIIGFIEPYRDPAGIRAEWEAVVGIAAKDEVARLKQLVNSSADFLRQLPWAVDGVNDGKGPYEKSLFEAPDFTSIHALAVAGSVVFEAANLPNDETIRENVGFKNIVLANRLSVNNNPNLPCHWVDPSEHSSFKAMTHIVRFLTTAIHELLGHGSGKLLAETEPGVYNFDRENPPLNPLTKKPITSHYLPLQNWGSVFGKLASTVEECRAILMSEYFMDNKQLLGIFGYTDTSEITADELLYATYMNIGVDGLQALQHYSAENQAWGQVHHQAHFSILKHVLRDGGGVVRIDHEPTTSALTVRVDRSKMSSHGKPALGDYLCRLHIWRCTADVSSCREFYEPLCAVDGEFEEWRKIVCSKPNPKWKFVQPNTFLKDGDVQVKVYDESNEGIIQSWAERAV
ncbi:dipeptidyl peptidase III [Cordyceps militaris]|uniref:Dipeptidyl peptidase III n=1 Tax=Cordyceps militaris TaxID=73501 RepID=A0A2H4STY0_CORMI|nr:dipeptidyl peptidase III [Cordyceps militaris]